MKMSIYLGRHVVSKIARYCKLKKRYLFSIILTILIYTLYCLQRKYGELFYLKTFLPKSQIQVQRTKGQINENTSFRKNQPQILCLISTSPQYHKSRAVHVAATWAKHCAKTIFMTSQADSELVDAYVIPEAPKYEDLWTKVSRSLDRVMEENIMTNYKCEWVLKADDDSFIIIENLQKALQSLNPNESIAAGQKLYLWDKSETYLNGGAGYVMSKESVSRFVTGGLRQKLCARNLKLGTEEDVNMSRCLRYLNVSLVGLRDSDGKRLFHIYPPLEEIDPREATSWKHLYLKKLSVDSYKFGITELSHQPVSFHYVDAEMMYLLYYLIYVVNPGKEFTPDRIPQNLLIDHFKI